LSGSISVPVFVGGEQILKAEHGKKRGFEDETPQALV
jgi:hypothetical protein